MYSQWSRYIENNWLNYSRGNLYCPEMKIKRMLDICGNYFLFDHTRGAGILTACKDMSIGKNEIPLTSCDDTILDKLESGEYDLISGQLRPRKDSALRLEQRNEKEREAAGPGISTKKAREPSRMEKISRHKNGPVHICRVDIDGCFECKRKTYMISEEVVAYKGVSTNVGKYYSMDTIYVFEQPDGTVKYCDQGINPIDSNMIIEVHE